MKKESAGALVILSGIAIIGFVWFKRNKPQIATTQLANLNAQANNIGAGANLIDIPFVYSQETINSQGVNPYSNTINLDASSFTPADIANIKTVTGGITDVQTSISNQIAQNLQNSSASLTQLGNLGLTQADWSNIKIK